MSKAYTINRLAEPRKWATLAAFVYTYESRAIDDALDLFDSLVQTRLTRAGRQGKKKRIRTLRDLDIAARRLGQIGKLLLSLNPHEPIYLDEVLFSIISREQLETAAIQVDTLTRQPDDNYYEQLLNHYNQFRRFLPTFWYTLDFDGLESEADLLEAIAFLKGLEPLNLPTLNRSSREQIVDEAPQAVITAVWQPYVIGEGGHIHLHYCAFCVLLQLRDALRRRSIFVAGSERWGALRDKLLSEATWRKVKTQVCRSLGHPTTPETMLEALEKQLDAAYKQVADNLPENTKARLETVADKTRFILEPLEGLERTGFVGEVAVADGLRFVVPVRSAHAGASDRYFGRQRGITWYHWMIDQQMDIHGIAIAGALRDAPYLLDGLLEQETINERGEAI